MSIVSAFKIAHAGYGKHRRHNRIFLDAPYGEQKNARQCYDLVFPKNAKGKTGLVLCIHGGGWVEGDKGPYTGSLFKVSEEYGVAAACLNYRYISKDVHFDHVLDDISSALSAIRKQCLQYGVILDKVLLTGISAGAHLSLLYAYTRRDTAPVLPVCVVEVCGPTDLSHPFFYSEKNRVVPNAGIDYFRNIIENGIGCTIDPAKLSSAKAALERFSPIHFVNESTVPTVLGHGEIDDIVPYQNSVDLDKKLTECGVEHTFVSFPNSNHECEDKPSMSRIMTLFFDYINTYLK